MTLAMQLSDEAVAKGHIHPNLLVLAAHHQLGAGAAGRALELAAMAREAAPRDADVLNILGLSLARLGRRREAVAIYEAALRQSPHAVVARFNKACVLEDLRELKQARGEFERVLEREPSHAEAMAHLADLAIQRGDLKAARDYADRALRHDVHQPASQLALSRIDIEEKRFAEALSRLEPLTRNASAINRSIAQGLIGDALDGLGKTVEAFAAYSASNATLRAAYGPIFEAENIEPARRRVLRLTEFFRSSGPRPWRNSVTTYESPVHGHVFLVGFPRSGTTLLEQVLAGHPDVETMEERDCLIDAANDFVLPPDGLDRLASLADRELAPYRDRYWQRAAAEGASYAKPVFLDKMPLNSVLLCLIAKLFPRARIIFALRDPRDVVLSCFRRRFVMTAQMFELTTIESSANYYASVMQLGETCRTTLDLDMCYARHEDLLNDFDAESRRLCGFLGLEWNASLRGFAERARAGMINTPSAPQVARGLSTGGMGQWRRFRDQMAPVLPKLAPWIARFDYPVD